MTAFIVVAAGMVVIALAWLLWPLLRVTSRAAVERHAANALIFRDQFADLDADLKRGTISNEQYAEAKAELERRLLDEARIDAAPASGASRGTVSAVVIALGVPVIAGLLYWKLGAPDAFSPIATAPEATHQLTPEQVDAMVGQLAERLKNEPDNIDGWLVLAKSYYTMGRFPQAADAYAKLTQLLPNEPSLLADYADALAMSQGRNLNGKPLELVEQALKVDPNHWKALAMAGTAAFDRKDYTLAVDYWERLRASQPADSPIAKSIAGSIDEARRLGGLAASSVAATGKAPPAQPVAKAEVQKTSPPAAGKSVSGIVSLSAALAGKVKPDDALFIFARPSDGSKMPIAILRAQVKDLPLKFSLDDSQAMSPAAKISNFEQVVVAARVSKSGSAMPQSGDLETVTKPVKVGTSGLAVTIDTVVP